MIQVLYRGLSLRVTNEPLFWAAESFKCEHAGPVFEAAALLRCSLWSLLEITRSVVIALPLHCVQHTACMHVYSMQLPLHCNLHSCDGICGLS